MVPWDHPAWLITYRQQQVEWQGRLDFCLLRLLSLDIDTTWGEIELGGNGRRKGDAKGRLAHS